MAEEEPREEQDLPLNAVFQGDQDDWDALPREMKEHITEAILHKAGLADHPGKYKGPPGILRRHGDQREERQEPSEDRLAEERMREMGPALQNQPGGPLPPQEAVQQPEQKQGKGKQPSQPHGTTPAGLGAQAVAPEEPQGDY